MSEEVVFDPNEHEKLCTFFNQKQAQALFLAANGYSGRGIAFAMGKSPESVGQYLFQARNRLGAANTANAVWLACHMGLL